MTYRVIYAPSFRDDIDRHIDYLLSQHAAPDVIDRWYSRLFELIDSLNEWPMRFPVDEIQTQATGRETRKANVGDYLVFYGVDEVHKQVNVVAFVHGARRRGPDESNAPSR